jgi:uncharacterized protein Yka (UPF0111/DUF47 family)
MAEIMAKSYSWFEQRHKTRGLELAHEQIVTAFATVELLYKAMKRFFENNSSQQARDISELYLVEEKVDNLRTAVFQELSTGAAFWLITVKTCCTL